MNQTSKEFRAWLLRQRVRDVSVTPASDTHYRIDMGSAVAQIYFWPYQDDLEIAEFQIVRTSDGEAIFYLHVLLDDLSRAQELFAQMAEALENEASHTTTQVLLCCTSALTTTLFAHKMSEVAQALSLDYEFKAMPAQRA